MATRAATTAARQKVEETKARSDANTEDTIVQVRNESGEWTDYARTTRREALAALEAGRLPGKSEPEPLRAVDWITREEVTAPKPRRTRKPAVTPGTVDGLTAKAKHGNPNRPSEATRRPKGGQKGVTRRRVAPVEPTRNGFRTDAQFAKALAAYGTALAAYRAETGEPAPAKAKSPAKPRKTTANPPVSPAPEEPAKKARPARVLGKQPSDTDGFNFQDPKLPARVLRLKGQGNTIKAITAELGLPAEEKFWHRVSLVYRAAADAKGIDRPRRNGAAKD